MKIFLTAIGIRVPFLLSAKREVTCNISADVVCKRQQEGDECILNGKTVRNIKELES